MLFEFQLILILSTIYQFINELYTTPFSLWMEKCVHAILCVCYFKFAGFYSHTMDNYFGIILKTLEPHLFGYERQKSEKWKIRSNNRFGRVEVANIWIIALVEKLVPFFQDSNVWKIDRIWNFQIKIFHLSTKLLTERNGQAPKIANPFVELLEQR